MTAQERPRQQTVRRCAVLGSPIAHSLSPTLHRAAYEHLGLPWEYGRHEVDEATFADFLAGLDASWRGLSLTMPLKQVALGAVDEVSETARTVRAVNTIVIEDDGRLRGDNTDVPGMVNGLRGRGVARVARGGILGGGATARSALAVLKEVAEAATVYVRTPARADLLLATAAALELPCAVRPWSERRDALAADVLVVTTTVGSTDDLAAEVPDSPGALLDVVYTEGVTPLAAAWAERGAPVLGGLDVLVEQALLQILLMTGQPVPARVLTDALARSAVFGRRERGASANPAMAGEE